MASGRSLRPGDGQQSLLFRTLCATISGIGQSVALSKTQRPHSSNYTTDELDTLVTEYEELGSFRGKKAWVHVRLIDIDRVLPYLAPGEAEAVFLVGICGFTQADAARMAGVSQATVSRRFMRGLEHLAHYLNGV